MHSIKKYSNRKLYDTKEKRFITMDEIADLIMAEKEVQIIDNKTGNDITNHVASQLIGRKAGADDNNGIPSNILFQLLRKGGSDVLGYMKKYIGLWQNVLTLADDEIDSLVNSYIVNKEITKSEGILLKKEIKERTKNFKQWVSGYVDQKMSNAMKQMKLVTTDQMQDLVILVEDLIGQVSDAEDKIEKLEKKLAEKPKKTKKVANKK